MDINELIIKAKKGDNKATERILKENKRFIQKVIKDTFPVFRFSHINYADLLQEGYIGMMNAIKSFDESKGIKFTTYAYYPIKSSILNFLEDNSRFIRIPGNTFWLVKRYVAIYNDFENELGHKPKDEEIAKEMKLSIEKVRKLSMLVDNVTSIEVLNEKDISYNQFDDDSDFFKEQVNKSLSSKFESIFNKLNLNNREREIMKLKFGFYGKVYGLTEIAKIYNISHQRVDQIIKNVIKKIRLTNYVEELAEYTEDYNYYMNNIKEYRKKVKTK